MRLTLGGTHTRTLSRTFELSEIYFQAVGYTPNWAPNRYTITSDFFSINLIRVMDLNDLCFLKPVKLLKPKIQLSLI